VFKLRSVSNIVIAPAKTGKDNSNKIAVINTDQTNSGIRSIVIPAARILITVVIKFTAPKIEEAPAICKEKIPMSTEAPAWAIPADKGGYTVQPVPTPLSTSPLPSSKVSEGGVIRILCYLFEGKLYLVLLV